MSEQQKELCECSPSQRDRDREQYQASRMPRPISDKGMERDVELSILDNWFDLKELAKY